MRRRIDYNDHKRIIQPLEGGEARRAEAGFALHLYGAGGAIHSASRGGAGNGDAGGCAADCGRHGGKECQDPPADPECAQ